MDRQIRTFDRARIIGNDPFAYRHAKRLPQPKKELTRKQRWRLHLKAHGLGFKFVRESDTWGPFTKIAVWDKSDKDYPPVFNLSYYGMCPSLAVAIYRINDDERTFNRCYASLECPNLTAYPTSQYAPFCYFCSMKSDALYPERKDLLHRQFQKYQWLGYTDDGAALLAIYDYDCLINGLPSLENLGEVER